MENINGIKFDLERLCASSKITHELLTSPNIECRQVLDDLINNLHTIILTECIYSNMADERELTYYCDKPSFFDWLFGRSKKVTFNLKVKDLLINPPSYKNTSCIYVIDEK